MNLVRILHHINPILPVAKIIIGSMSAIAFLLAISLLLAQRNGKGEKKRAYRAFIGGVLALILFIGLFAVPHILSNWMPNSPYIAVAKADAQVAGIDPDIFVRQINQESGFDPQARSASGAEGIAQFMPSTAHDLGINPWDPEQSLRAAASYMASLLKDYNQDYAKALAAYNAGPGPVALDDPNWFSYLPAETQDYVNAILERG